MSWEPTTDFEEEIVSLQPDYNFIFGNNAATAPPEAFYPRPSAHLQFAATQKTKQQRAQSDAANMPSAHNQKLNVIAKVQRIAGTKPLGEQPTVEDWDNADHVERETVAMMRHCGLGPSIEEPLDERCTIATVPITEEMRIMHSGPKRVPIFFDEKFFKLKPRVSNSSSGAESGGSGSANNSMFSTMSGENSSGDASNSSAATTADGDDDDDENVRSGQRATCLPTRDHEMNYEKLQNVADISSDLSSCFATAAEETGLEAEDSYGTALNSRQFIPSHSWYRSSDSSFNSSTNRSEKNWRIIVGGEKSGRNVGGDEKRWRSGGSTSSSSFSLGSSDQNSKPQRFYTARELYDRKRHQ